MNDSPSFGNWLKRRRKALDLTQHDLAQQIGCSVATVRKIESDERRPSRQIAERLADCLEIGPDARPGFLRAARAITGGSQPDAVIRAAGAEHVPGPISHQHNLPAQPTPLIGREQEIAALRKYLLHGTTRLITLSGPAGVGKTRLALQVAFELGNQFADGVFWVALAALTDPALVATTIAQTLGIAKTGGRSPSVSLTSALREKELLLLLDNFEQIVAAAPLIAELLEACPRIKILVTSRVRLCLRWEQQFPVLPLTLPDMARLPSHDVIARAPAVALFVNRAQAVLPDLLLTPATLATIAAICARLDGLPLAIELVAAQISMMSPEEILARLDHRFTLLCTGPHDLPARHQTLWEAVEWSYRILGGDEQALFVRLGVFVGSWTLGAAETVCTDPQPIADRPALSVLRGLNALVNHSLITRRDQPGAARFSMLETIHEYALERLNASAEADSIRRAHADYYTALAEQAEPLLTGGEQQIWLRRLDDDHDNLRAALAWTIARGAVELALRLCGALGRFWFMRDHCQEGSAWLAQVLALDGGEAAAFAPARAKALNTAGVLAWAQGEHARAEHCFTQCLALHQQLGDRSGIAVVLNNLANVARDSRNYQQAQHFYEQSLALHRQLGNQHAIASSLHNLGLVATHQGDDARAALLLEESLTLRRELGDEWGIAAALNDLGLAARRQHDAARAQRLLEESLMLFRALGDRRCGAHALHRLARLACDQGDLARAATLCAESLAICYELEDREGIAVNLEILASVAAEQGRLIEAAQLWGAAEALRELCGVLLPPGDSGAYRHQVSSARAALGAEGFLIAWSVGRTMSLERTIANALSA